MEVDKVEKDITRSSDTTSERGYSTDQQINVEFLNVQKKKFKHNKKETSLVALGMNESALVQRIEAAEHRAEMRCPSSCADNIYWKRVEVLLKEQQDLIDQMKAYTSNLKSDSSDNDEGVIPKGVAIPIDIDDDSNILKNSTET